MDFRELNYICTIAEHRSITKAAAALFVSQPSLSHFVSKAETELGVKLFDRSTTPISLTFAGEHYVREAKQILQINQQMRKQFRDISHNMTGRLRVGMPRERAAYMLPIIMPEYKKELPGIEVQLYSAGGRDLFDALGKGQIDFMILPYHIHEKGMRSFPIYEEELVLAAGKGMIQARHLLEGHSDTVDLSKLADEKFIVLAEGHAIRTSLNLLFQSHHISPPLLMETHSNMTCVRMASAGLGLSIVPRMTLEITKCHSEYEVYSLGVPPVTWEVIAICRSDAYIGIAEQSFLDIAQRVFSDKNHLTP